MAVSAPAGGATKASPPGRGLAVDGTGAERPRRRGLTARFSSGHLLMIVAGLVAVVASIAILGDEPIGVRVAIAAHEIRAGEEIEASDFRAERVQAPDHLLDTLVRHADVAKLHDRIAATTMEPGALVARSDLLTRAASSGLRAMSIPIDRSRAVSGRLGPGDRIDVLFTGERAVSIIVADARVIAVEEKGSGGLGEMSSPFTVTVAVDARQSQLLAAAIADGEISIARTTGARSSRGTPARPLDRIGRAETDGDDE